MGLATGWDTIADKTRVQLAGVLDPEELVPMVKSQELLQVFGIIWRVLSELVLAQAAGVTYKICLKPAGVSVAEL